MNGEDRLPVSTDGIEFSEEEEDNILIGVAM